MGGFMTGRATANMLTRITAGLAAVFIVTSLTLAIIAGGGRERPGSIIDQPAAAEEPAEAPGPAVPLAK